MIMIKRIQTVVLLAASLAVVAGCMDRSAVGQEKPGRPSGAAMSSGMPELPDVRFEFNQAVIRGNESRTLDKHAEWLKANPAATVVIEGHGDERGSDVYNTALGERRSNAARTYLIGKGIKPERMRLVSRGESEPVCRDRSEMCWAQNRRAHVKIATP
jgi:peptidoglycan-associated lipoprotein